jgi:ABC-type glucose/galactose transport system permease subunit
MKTADAAASINQGAVFNKSPTMSIQESLQAAKTYAVSFSNKIKYGCRQMPVYNWIIIAILAVTFIVAGFWLRRLTSALCCAALGTILIFSGMILLLSYKGSTPISRIADRIACYVTVFIAMIAFGTFEQLLLCRKTKKQPIEKQKTDKNKQEPKLISQDWRTT